MTRRLLLAYWLTLAAGHFLLDMVGGMFAPLLPALMVKYGVTLAVAAMAPALINISCNAGQVAFGSWSDRSPIAARLLLWTPIIAAAPLFLGLVDSPAALAALLLIGGAAMSLFHPVGIHEVQTLPHLPRGTVVSLFMAVGLCGWACGSFVGAVIVEKLGMFWLWLPAVPAAAITVALILLGPKISRIRSRQPSAAAPKRYREEGYSFPLILAAGFMAATSCTLLLTFFPTYIEAQHGTVIPAGQANMFFGFFGVAGGAILGFLGGRLPRGYVIGAGLLLATAMLALYFIVDDSLIWYELSGLGLGSAFPLLVAMSHEARGRASNFRNGMIVGGCWGLAALLLLPVGKMGDAWHIERVYPWLALTVPPAALLLLLMEYARARRRFFTGAPSLPEAG